MIERTRFGIINGDERSPQPLKDFIDHSCIFRVMACRIVPYCGNLDIEPVKQYSQALRTLQERLHVKFSSRYPGIVSYYCLDFQDSGSEIVWQNNPGAERGDQAQVHLGVPE